MNDPLAGYAKLLNDVAEICSILVDPAVMPALGSPADEELRTARSLNTGAGCWGEEPVRASYALAAINYCAALDQAKAMVALMSGECTAVPVMVLGRSLIEVSSRPGGCLSLRSALSPGSSDTSSRAMAAQSKVSAHCWPTAFLPLKWLSTFKRLRWSRTTREA